MEIVAIAVQRWPEWDVSVTWKRTYGRFDPGGSPYVSVLYQHPACSWKLCFVEIFHQQPKENTNTVQLFDESLGWLQLRRFPDDPCLTNLSQVLGNTDDLDVLRYRPYKRCTFRLSHSEYAMPIIGKMFADRRGEQIHLESIAIWDTAIRGQLQFAVAKPIAWDESTETLWQHVVPGHSITDQLLSRNGSQIAERIGRAAASITKSSLKPALRFGGAEQMRRSTKYASELSRQLPDLIDNLDTLLESLAKNHRTTPGRELKPLHGAPHLHQWLVSEHGLGLVDFDRICVGDPELDAATFIAEMDFEDPDNVPISEINGSFLEGYQQTAGRLDPCLLQTYRCHKRLAKALKAARAINGNADRKARRHVEFAHQALG